MIDERFAIALHVDALRRDALHAESDPAVLFQTSTIAALLEGAYEGDVSFAELAEHGDLGLGTLNALDGEMIAVDGGFYRADADGRVGVVDPSQRTPFAVVVPFQASRGFAIQQPTTQAELLALLDVDRRPGEVACAIRIDGRFRRIKARSVPKQYPPYAPLGEVVTSQHVFELTGVDAEGALVGFRFPDHSDGIEVDGYHLHFVSADRARGGHVLDFELLGGTVELDEATELHVELPPGVDLTAAHLDSAGAESLRRIEHGD